MTSEMSDGSRWTCNGKRSISRASSICLSSRPLTSFAELLLRRHDDPVLAPALHAEALHDSLQVEHLLHVARDELADFVHDEHQDFARAVRRFISSSTRSASLPGVMSALSFTAFDP